jgi:hypothetical protein
LFPLLVRALIAAVGTLEARDRMRLRCYYVQQLTLADIGRMFGEHEATASRHLARIRRALGDGIQRELRDRHQLSAAEIDQARRAALDNTGALDLGRLLADSDARKESAEDRSK